MTIASARPDSRDRGNPAPSARRWHPESALRQAFNVRTLALGGTSLAIAYLTIIPLVFLIYNTFFQSGSISLGGFKRAYGAGSGVGAMIVNSLEFAAGSAALSLALGTALAWVQVRTNAPFKALLFAASLGPLIMPGVLYTTAWTFLGDPRIGIINTNLFKPAIGAMPINIYSMPGMIWVQGLHHAPIAFLLMVGAFRAMDPSLEESAQVCGGSRFAVAARITLPVLRPALIAGALLVFVLSIESFEVPALLGLPNGTYVFTSRIYLALRRFPIDYGAAGAYALLLVLVAGLGVLVSNWLARRGRSFQTVTGKAFRPRPIELGRARPYAGAAVALYFLIAVVLPLVVLMYASLLPYYRPPSTAAFDSFSMSNYTSLLNTPTITTALKNSLIIGVLTPTCAMVLSAICAWIVVRTRIPGRGLLDALAFTPIVIPGLVFGLALIYVYLRFAVFIYGTLWILLIALVTKYLPYGMRYSTSAITQVGNELEESATVAGASWFQSFRRIIVPLTSIGFIAGWMYIFVVSFRELSAAILLYTPGHEVLPVIVFQMFQKGQFTLVAALGVVMVVFLMLVTFVVYKLGAKIGLSHDEGRP